MSRFLVALALVSARPGGRVRGSKVALAGGKKKGEEDVIRDAYVDKHAVHHGQILVDGKDVEFLEAGPKSAAKTVLFCHGAAFSMATWQHVGVLDALAKAGIRAIALNLPGYGKSSKTITKGGKSGFLRSVAGALELPHTLMVVAASMGGSYALPFVAEPGPYNIAGYVAVAAVNTPGRTINMPVLGIYGSEDQPRLDRDKTSYFDGEQYGNRTQLVVFAGAPHPCYLRDIAAARQFSTLVVKFAFAGGAETPEPALSVHAVW